MKIPPDELRLKLPISLLTFFTLGGSWLIDHASAQGKLAVTIQPSASRDEMLKKPQPARKRFLLTVQA